MSTVILSVIPEGFTLTKGGKLLHSKFYKNKEGRVRDRVMRSFEKGLVQAKEVVDHSLMVIELTDTFVYTHIADDTTIPRTDQGTIYKLSSLLEECDASIVIKKVKNAQAKLYLKHGKPVKEETESVSGLFEGLIEGEDL